MKLNNKKKRFRCTKCIMLYISNFTTVSVSLLVTENLPSTHKSVFRTYKKIYNTHCFNSPLIYLKLETNKKKTSLPAVTFSQC